jgi:hypothetical protein
LRDRGAAGVSCRIAPNIAPGVFPEKGGRPVAIS